MAGAAGKDVYAGATNDAFSRDEAEVVAIAAARAGAELLGEVEGEGGLVSLVATLVGYAGQVTRERTAAREARRLPVVAPACAEGCAACCHLHVSISMPEAFVLRAYLEDQLAPDDLAALVRRVEAAKGAPHGQAERVRDKRPCPLLVDARCVAYRVRPLACIAASSTDPARCEKAFADRDPDAQIPIEPVRAAAVRAVQLGLGAAVWSRGLDPRRYELSHALAAAFATSPERYLEGATFAEAATPGDPAAAAIELASAAVAADAKLG